jgi:hypothetical protein
MSHLGAGPLPVETEDDLPRVVAVRDVLVVPSPGHQADPQEWLDYPAVEGPADLGNGVFLERLRGDEDLAEQVIHASVPRGLNFEATRQFGQLYSFWRDVPDEEIDGSSLFAWDPSQSIAEVIALARFVRDNANGFEFAGRVVDRSDGRRRIAPLNGHDGRIAYRARRDRFWFTAAEARELRAFLDQYRSVKNLLPDRVQRALWHADRGSYSRYMQEALTNIVIGLEALLNTGEDHPVTAQFVQRSQSLAAEFGIDTSRSYWRWVYKSRSAIVHGARSKLVAPAGWDETEDDPPADVAKIAKAQDVLRKAIRKAIEDDGFRSVFENEDSIRERWPLNESACGLVRRYARLLRRKFR